jgi:peptidoglycan/xylan/chitin deacetylase (PgdA/CDA1 family)
MAKPGRSEVRRGPGPATLVVFTACIVALLRAHPTPDPNAGPSARATVPAPSVAPPARRLNAPAPVTDALSVQHRSADGHTVALTFDDGPDPRWTPTVLELLRRHHTRATFCIVGQYIEAHPELVRRIAEDGHALCDHTWSHDEALSRRPRAAVRAELVRTYDAIVAASGGVAPRYFRAPAGRWGSVVVAEARRLRLQPLGWSVDPSDWRRPPAAEIARRVLAGATPGAIVLLHDGYGARAGTVAALDVILRALAARGVRLGIP